MDHAFAFIKRSSNFVTKYKHCPVIWHGTQLLEVAHQEANTYIFSDLFLCISLIYYTATLHDRFFSGHCCTDGLEDCYADPRHQLVWSSQPKQLLFYWWIVILLHWSKASIDRLMIHQFLAALFMVMNCPDWNALFSKSLFYKPVNFDWNWNLQMSFTEVLCVWLLLWMHCIGGICCATSPFARL